MSQGKSSITCHRHFPEGQRIRRRIYRVILDNLSLGFSWREENSMGGSTCHLEYFSTEMFPTSGAFKGTSPESVPDNFLPGLSARNRIIRENYRCSYADTSFLIVSRRNRRANISKIIVLRISPKAPTTGFDHAKRNGPFNQETTAERANNR